MMNLRTFPEPASDTDGHFVVTWAVGINRGGKVEVMLPPGLSEGLLIAELCALRYLLLERRVFNATPTSGQGVCLWVSTGAIRKLVLKKSAKKEAVPYAAFLGTRMRDAQIEVVSKKDALPFTSAQLEHDTIRPDPDIYTMADDPIETPALGTIYITAHAVERYIERSDSGEAKSPWATLVKRLRHPGLKPYTIPERHQLHKRRKYGEDNSIEAWGHPTSRLIFLTVNRGAHRVVVTVFRHNSSSA